MVSWSKSRQQKTKEKHMSKLPMHGHSDSDLEERLVDAGAGGSYCFVSPRKRRAAVENPNPPAEMTVNDFEDNADTVFVQRTNTEPGLLAPKQPVRTFKKAEYKDPNLCSCGKMHEALQAKIISVIVAGPVTLPPALITEKALLDGQFDQQKIEKTYDGKFWALRYCPFEKGVLIDDQVPVPARVDDGIVCCSMMQMALMHDRVDLPAPHRSTQAYMMFVSPGKPDHHFTTCPWCATTADDLCLTRFTHYLDLHRQR
jgi:hypothetical protein